MPSTVRRQAAGARVEPGQLEFVGEVQRWLLQQRRDVRALQLN